MLTPRAALWIALAVCGTSACTQGDLSLGGLPTIGDAGPTPSRTIFLNFDGGRLTSGTTDATQNLTDQLPEPCQSAGYQDVEPLAQTCQPDTLPCRVGTCTGRVIDPTTGFRQCSEPDDDYRAAVADQVRALLAPFNVSVVTERPATGPYDMAMLAQYYECPVDGGGWSIEGCGLSQQNQVFLVAQGPSWEYPAWEYGRLAAHIVGDTLGLSLVTTQDINGDGVVDASDSLGDPMETEWGNGVIGFYDGCRPVDTDGCRGVADQFCPAGLKNDYRMLTSILGTVP